MAFYYDNRYGDILFSEHEYYGGNIHFPRETRPAMHEWAIFGQLVSDLPNMYGDLYESFKAKGYDMNDPLWKRENMKEGALHGTGVIGLTGVFDQIWDMEGWLEMRGDSCVTLASPVL